MADKESIVFINQNAGYLMIDIIHANSQYKKRAIITGKLVERNLRLDSSVKVEKIITYNRSSGFKRLFTWGWGFIQILWLVKTKYRKSTLFIVTNPPFAIFIPLFCRNNFSLLVYDIYPDALIAYKMIGANSFLAGWWEKANKRVFTKANNVFTISDGMKKSLGKYADLKKIKTVPIWTDNRFLKPIPKEENNFIRNNQLQNKFLVVYSGNLGHSHPVEALVEIAAAIKDKDILFLIIGEGNKKELINERIKAYQLSNCILLPFQEVTMLPQSLSSANLGVVTLGKEASSLSVPSKTFNLMSVGVPILGIAGQGSELSALLSQFKFGQCFNETDIAAMISFIKLVKSDTLYREVLQKNALSASNNFGPENAMKFVVQ
jgi:glycosyltransferase involved in cell wall biosynthesis